MALEIRKKAVKNFEHIYNNYKLTFSDLRIAFNGTTQNVLITRENGAFVIKREGFNVTEISVYDDTGAGTEETFVNVTVLANRLIELGYIAFYEDGDIVPSEFISSDASNALVIGTDGLLFVPPAGAATNGLPVGGTTGQILKKQSATDFDADWEDENLAPSTTPATNKITFGLAAINNTSGDITSVNEMIAAMNTVGFTITAGYLSVLEVQVYRNINGEKWRVFLRYLFKNNNITGTWGTGSTNGEININHLIELTWRPFIRVETDAEYNDLGDIGASTIEDYLNGLPTGTYTLNNLTKDYYFTCKINGQDQVYQVKNASLPLTISDDTVTGADFDLVASSDTPEAQEIPTENQIKAKIVEATVSGTYELDIDT